MRKNIKGEEEPVFVNVLGEKVTVEIKKDVSDTKSLLLKVLDGNTVAAEALAQEIHRVVKPVMTMELPDIVNNIELKKVGIWIDPIDGTAEYINGKYSPTELPNIDKSGLKCATVLIGAYNKDTSKPIIGVINQPFFTQLEDTYESKIVWGTSINGENHHNIVETSSDTTKKIAIISGAETKKGNLESAGYKCVAANGAGYKLLKVIENDASIYFLTKNSTYKWDTCAGQAILQAVGGDVIDLQQSIAKKKPISLTYKENEDRCNKNGLIAYRNVTHLINLIPSFL